MNILAFHRHRRQLASAKAAWDARQPPEYYESMYGEEEEKEDSEK